MVARDDPTRYADLLDLGTVERFVFETNPRAGDLQVLHAGPVDRGEYVYPSGLVDSIALSHLYEDGHSFVLPQANSHFPSLGYLIRGLEAEVGCRAQANVYLSPPGAAAFAPHYDAHDVLVLQAHGAKQWTLFEGPEPVPSTVPFDAERHAPGRELDSFILRTGDLCYLPRGLLHHAAATTEASLHITVGIHWVSFLDVIQTAVERAGADQPALRRALPPDWWVDDAARADTLRTVCEHLGLLVDDELLGGALDHLRDDLVSSRQPLVPGQLDQLRRIEDIDLPTLVAPRDPMVVDLRVGGDQVVLACFGSEIAFPMSALPALAQLLDTGPGGVAVADLAGDLDGDEKLVLVRRLVREGVVTARW